MPGISIITERHYKRIYRTFSFRDANKKPQNQRKAIGIIDKNTNKPIFNDFFKNLLAEQDISMDLINSIPLTDIPKYVDFGSFSVPKANVTNDLERKEDTKIDKINSKELKYKFFDDNTNKEENSNISYKVNDNHYTFLTSDCHSKILGPHLLLQKIAEDTGLLDIMKNVFPEDWDKIITLAYYLVMNNESMINLQLWVDDNETYLANNQSMETKRISELLSRIQYSQIINFYESWAGYRAENEYLALDITSISSYSNLIPSVEHGYNRDKEKLEQVNVCLLFGEKSGLPIFSSLYPGSLNDVTILRSFIQQIEFFKNKTYNLVMDKDFYSKRNILFLLDKYKEYNFLIAVPFTTKIARQIIKNGHLKFNYNAPFMISDDILLGYSFVTELDFINKVKYHVIYNDYLYQNAKRCLLEKVILLKKQLILNPKDILGTKECKKYLIFDPKLPLINTNISINIERIEYEVLNKGWLIIVGNDLNINYDQVVNIYRNKDDIEKAFLNMNNKLFFKRLRVHSNKNASNKLFIVIIGLIIHSYIHTIMSKNNLYNKYTISKLLKMLTKIKIFKLNDSLFTKAPSKQVKELLKYFGIEIKV